MIPGESRRFWISSDIKARLVDFTNADKHLHFEIQLLAVELSCFENVFDVETLDQIGAHFANLQTAKSAVGKVPCFTFRP